MRLIFPALALSLASFATPSLAALGPDRAPDQTLPQSLPTLSVQETVPLDMPFASATTLDHLKRKVSRDGMTTLAVAQLGPKTHILHSRVERLQFAETQIKAINPAAATTLLIFASGCLMWLGLYEKRPY